VGEHLILSDGECALCHRLVRLVLRRDAAGRFDFAALQGPTARELLARLGRPPPGLDTVLVVTGYRSAAPAVLERSRAALAVAASLGPPLSWLRLLGALPAPLLDRGYDLVARHRHRLGAAACLVPLPEDRPRFLDLPASVPPGGAAPGAPGA
jgi:predicted DCC family thiol-disulfide oxidoreductase YuxK